MYTCIICIHIKWLGPGLGSQKRRTLFGHVSTRKEASHGAQRPESAGFGTVREHPRGPIFFPESPARCHDLEVFFGGAFLALSRLGLLYLALFGMWRLTAPGVFFQGFQDLGLLMIHHRPGLGTFQDVGAANFQDVAAATSAPMRYR